MKDNNIENIVTLELVKEDELYKFKKDLQESFSVAVIEEFGSVDAGPIPSDEEIEKSFNAPGAVIYHILSNGIKVGGVVVSINEETQHNSLDFLLINIGMIMNIFSLLGGILIVLSPNAMKLIIKMSVNLLSKLKLFKTLNEKLNIINKFIDEYSYSINLFVKNKKALYLSVILTIAQLTVFFSVSYCIYRAFNLNEETYIYILSLQAILYMSISAVPTPGNVGANEIAFFMILASVFPKSIIGYCVFLYSVFVYYFLVIVGGLFTVQTHYHMNKEKIKI